MKLCRPIAGHEHSASPSLHTLLGTAISVTSGMLWNTPPSQALHASEMDERGPLLQVRNIGGPCLSRLLTFLLSLLQA